MVDLRSASASSAIGRATGLLIALGALLVTPACNRGIAGSYDCTGMPDIRTLTLESNGSYTTTGSILGHATPGSGRYKLQGDQLTLEGSYRVDGLTQVEPNKVVFDRQKSGELKALLTSCRK